MLVDHPCWPVDALGSIDTLLRFSLSEILPVMVVGRIGCRIGRFSLDGRMECCLRRQFRPGSRVGGSLRIEDGNFRVNSLHFVVLPLGDVETHNSEIVVFVTNNKFIM